MMSRTVKRSVLKLVAVALLVGSHSSLATATEYFCNGQGPCSDVDSCEGTGIAWSGCELWCYINGGQQQSGYADCGDVIES